MNTEVDTRSCCRRSPAPTLVIYRKGDREVSAEEGRWIADQIPHAKYVELPGADHLPWIGESDALLDEVEEFLTGVRRGPDPDRLLATVLFTDIVDCEGGRARRPTLARVARGASRLVRRELDRFGGREIDTAGDGFFATFDGPARAVRCACAINEAVRELGLDVRAGLHTGECEVVDGTVGGIAVHIGARVADEAGAGEVLVSSTVKDLVAGSGLRFRERGVIQLRGVPGEWRLYLVEAGA
jgi:class 3 adenylate cyclase